MPAYRSIPDVDADERAPRTPAMWSVAKFRDEAVRRGWQPRTIELLLKGSLPKFSIPIDGVLVTLRP